MEIETATVVATAVESIADVESDIESDNSFYSEDSDYIHREKKSHKFWCKMRLFCLKWKITI